MYHTSSINSPEKLGWTDLLEYSNIDEKIKIPIKEVPNNTVTPLLVVRKVLPINYERQEIYHNPEYSPEASDLKFHENYLARLTEHAVAIKPCFQGEKRPQIDCPVELLAQTRLKQEELEELALHCSSLAHDPIRFMQYLKPIEESLGKTLKERGIAFGEKDVPDFIMAGKGHYIPGPAPEGYQPKKKGHIIDEVLLEREREMGLNKEGTPTFVGGIDGNEANQFITKGHIFKEDVQICTLLLHGKNSHRLFFQAIMESLKGTKFEHLSPKDVLQLLVTTIVLNRDEPSVLWVHLMDTNSDMVEPVRSEDIETKRKYVLEHTSYNFSLHSPFLFNSLILCFGNELGLSNLMHCMLDSHWKAARKMTDRLSKVENRDVCYITAMEALTLAPLADIGRGYRFTEISYNTTLDKKYRRYPGVSKNATGIMLKLKRGEELPPEERKKELFHYLDTLFFDRFVMKDPANQDLVVEYAKTKATPKQSLKLFELCIFESLPHVQALGERLLALDFAKSLDSMDKIEFERAIEFWNEKLKNAE